VHSGSARVGHPHPLGVLITNFCDPLAPLMGIQDGDSPNTIWEWVEWLFFRLPREERDLLTKLKSSGRYLALSELEPKLTAESGTLMFELRSIKNGPLLVWWTEDDIIGRAPVALPGRTGCPDDARDEEEIWSFAAACVREYLDEDTGTASLTRYPPERLKTDPERLHIGTTPTVTFFTWLDKPICFRGYV